ncbi:MAG: group II intron reverse transcriptase domain-containing protein [Proteobacteria bacterium]|nr:group II intron reverse transcriptase domain-containing protein [Pseudomonadota bacterium]
MLAFPPQYSESDIKNYYENIDHEALLEEVFQLSQDEYLTSLVHQSLTVPSTWGGLYYQRKRGIPRASPLSPLLGALALNPLDQAMTKIKGIFYARFMDDWVVLCKTRNQLRKVIKITHQILNQLKLSLHPDKTTIGKIKNGFDFLGFHFAPELLTVAKITLERTMSKMQQLYEQGATLKRLADYWRRFLQWVKSVRSIGPIATAGGCRARNGTRNVHTSDYPD